MVSSGCGIRGAADLGSERPLYPLLVMSSALALTATVLRARVGWIAALAFVAFAALDSGLMDFGVAGLESPLTVLLLALALSLTTCLFFIDHMRIFVSR